MITPINKAKYEIAKLGNATNNLKVQLCFNLKLMGLLWSEKILALLIVDNSFFHSVISVKGNHKIRLYLVFCTFMGTLHPNLKV